MTLLCAPGHGYAYTVLYSKTVYLLTQQGIAG